MTDSDAHPASTEAGSASSTAALLLLADGRLPSGGYAHSGGLEAAIRAGWVRGPEDLPQFLRGRAHTSGFVAASFAAAACAHAADPRMLLRLDAELLARTSAPALRTLGVTLGRVLHRAMTSIRPHPLLAEAPSGLQHPIVFGIVGRSLTLNPADIASVVLHDAVTGQATAAVKLMHIDPFQAHQAIAALGSEMDELAARAADYADRDPADLPAYTGPLTELAAQLHTRLDARLFAS